MEKIIDALQQWSDYQKTRPGSSFEDFCRYYLAGSKIKTVPQSIYKPGGPTDPDGMFMMTVARCTLSFWVFMRIALRDTPLPTVEDVMLCSALNSLGESRKTDLINHAMMEISTGTDNLNRLIKKGFVRQRTDPDDKRSKLLTLSPTGLTALKQCFAKGTMAREIFLADMDDEDKKLVATILYPLQEKNSKLSVANKGKSIEEIYSEVIGERKKVKR